MVCFKYTPHTNCDIRYEVSQGVSMCPKTVSSCPQSISRCPESISRCPHFFQAHLEYCHKGSLWGCESSRFGFTTAKNIMKQNQNYSNQTCGSNVMENILFMAAIFKNGSHFEFLFFKSVDDKESQCQVWCLYQHLKYHFAYHTALTKQNFSKKKGFRVRSSYGDFHNFAWEDSLGLFCVIDYMSLKPKQ